MGLIKKEVIAKWHNSNIKHYINKGYVFTKYGDKFIVDVNDLPKYSLEMVDAQCEECDVIENISFESYYKRKYGISSSSNRTVFRCCGCTEKLRMKNLLDVKLKQSKSFGQWCLDELSYNEAQKILSRWDYDKNICSPFEVFYSSSNKYWFKCLDHDEHESEQKSICGFTGSKSKLQCNQCNNIYYKRPDLVKYFANVEDSKNHTCFENLSVYTICPICGYISKKHLQHLSTSKYFCPKCGDGISYSNKFAFELLEQLNIDFIPEFSKPWSNHRRYDFYFKHDSQEYIVEMDGGFHFIDNTMSGQTVEDVKLIDKEKDRLAEENGIHMIRIDCRDTSIESIKNNIFHSDIAKIFDLSIINWEKCDEYATKSIVIHVYKLWNEGKSPNQIIDEVQISMSCLRKYIRRGINMGLCDYRTYYRKKVICVTTNEIFNSVKEAGLKYNVSSGNISLNAKGKTKYSCKLPDGTKLHWKYYEDWLNESL